MSDEALARLCTQYLQAVKDHMLAGQLVGSEDSLEARPSEQWLRIIESRVGITPEQADGFRQQLMATVGALALEGREFSWQSDDRLQQALQMQLAAESQPAEIDSLRQQARIALAAQDDSGAIKVLSRLLMQVANEPRALQDRGLAQLRLGAYQQAVEDLTAVLASEPSNSLAAYHRGCAWFAMQQWTQAIPDLELALTLTGSANEVYVRDAAERLERIRREQTSNTSGDEDFSSAASDAADSRVSQSQLAAQPAVSSGGPTKRVTAKEAERLDCICTKCFQIYSGKIPLGSEMKCTSCGAIFTVSRFFGKMAEGVDWLAWIAGRKCLNCSSRRSQTLGVKRNEILLDNGRWKFWNWTYRRCEKCGSTWVIP